MPASKPAVTILVVDDDPGLTRLIMRELRREGFQTASAGSGQEAADWLAQHPADLLLLDLKLPDVEGPALIEAMAAAGHNVPFIIITGQGDERVAVDMMRRGALDYLVKDVNFIEFVATVVRRGLARLEQQQQLAEAEQALVRSHAELEERVIERTAELQRTNAELLKARRFAEATIEAIPASLAVLNEHGVIISTNEAWNAFAKANNGSVHAAGNGANYLAVCESATGDGAEEAAGFAAGIRDTMNGVIPRFSMEYPCHSPTEQRWFVGYVTPFIGNGPQSVVIAHVDISARKRAEQVIRRMNTELETRVEERTRELHLTNEELHRQIDERRRLEEEILQISEHEKQRIGHDLHDDLGQQLAGIWCLSQVLSASLTAGKASQAEESTKITRLLKDALALTRSLARGLHPVAVESGGLVAALDELTQRSADMFRLKCRCCCPPEINLSNNAATHLYRIAQEAVTNAVKHGHAREIDIELSTNPLHTVLSVKDNGSGLPMLDPQRQGMGLRIMKYRTDMIGGMLDIQNNCSGAGAIVTCMIPTQTNSKS